jgi:hypothetical protein
MFFSQLRARLKKFTVNDHFAKDTELWEPNWLKSGGEIEENWKFNGQLRVKLLKSKTKDQKKKKTLKFKADIKVRHG